LHPTSKRWKKLLRDVLSQRRSILFLVRAVDNAKHVLCEIRRFVRTKIRKSFTNSCCCYTTLEIASELSETNTKTSWCKKERDTFWRFRNKGINNDTG
jgi:hypothetical protein